VIAWLAWISDAPGPSPTRSRRAGVSSPALDSRMLSGFTCIASRPSRTCAPKMSATRASPPLPSVRATNTAPRSERKNTTSWPRPNSSTAARPSHSTERGLKKADLRLRLGMGG